MASAFQTAAVLTVVLMLIWISYVDLKEMIIPNEFSLTICIAGSVGRITEAIEFKTADGLISSFKGLLFIVIVFSIIYFFSQNGMGHGDFKLFMALSPLFSFLEMTAVFIMSFNIAAVISIILIAMKRKSRKSRIPFAPFIAAGSIAVIVFRYMSFGSLISFGTYTF